MRLLGRAAWALIMSIHRSGSLLNRALAAKLLHRRLAPPPSVSTWNATSGQLMG